MAPTETRSYIDKWAARPLARPLMLQPRSNGGAGRGGERPVTRGARLAIFAEAVEILAKEGSRPIRLEEVARRVATSPRQLQRIFAEVAGLGFRSYLRRLRMSKATDLLATTELPVKEIARAVGYGDASQFSKAFRRTYGVSPSQSRVMARDRRAESGRVRPSPSG